MVKINTYLFFSFVFFGAIFIYLSRLFFDNYKKIRKYKTKRSKGYKKLKLRLDLYIFIIFFLFFNFYICYNAYSIMLENSESRSYYKVEKGMNISNVDYGIHIEETKNYILEYKCIGDENFELVRIKEYKN